MDWQGDAQRLRTNGEAFAALVSAAGRADLGRRSLLATRLQAVPLLPPESGRDWPARLRAAAAASFAAGARGILVLVSHEAAGFFDDFDTHPPWQGLAPIQLWAAHEVTEYPPGGVSEANTNLGLKTRPSWDATMHAEAMGEVQAAIARGDCYQVCLTYPILTEVPTHSGATFQRLLARQAVDHAAWIFLPTASVVAGANSPRRSTKWPEKSQEISSAELEVLCCSPERFFSLVNGQVIVQPMKGTRALSPAGSAEEAARVSSLLQGAEKDRAENIMIVDLMRNDLGRVCQPGSVEVQRLCEVHTYASVAQMTSTVTGVLQPGCDVWDVLAACFPPGSMTGAPKIEACKWIRRLERGPRGLYGGTIGWLEPNGDAEFNVVIRSMQILSGQARWDVGGGIVADSTADEEWLETRAKAALLI